MNTREDNAWKNLLAESAPTFAGDTAAPFGFTTRVLARVRDERIQEAAWERIGLRAIFASLATVVALAILTLARPSASDDADAPVRSLVQVENVQVS